MEEWPIFVCFSVFEMMFLLDPKCGGWFRDFPGAKRAPYSLPHLLYLNSSSHLISLIKFDGYSQWRLLESTDLHDLVICRKIMMVNRRPMWRVNMGSLSLEVCFSTPGWHLEALVSYN